MQDYNSLPSYVKQAMDINTFKNNLDHHRGTPSMTGSRSTDDRQGRQNRNRGSSGNHHEDSFHTTSVVLRIIVPLK